MVVTGTLKGHLFGHTRTYTRGRTRVLGGFDRLVGHVNRLQAEAVRTGTPFLAVDLGNNLSGSVEAYVTKGEAVTSLMNRVPLSASLVNNLEFTFGPAVLAGRASAATFPMLSSNLTFDDPTLSSKVIKERLVKAGGLTIGILGLSPTNLTQICSPSVLGGVHLTASIGEVVARARTMKSKDGANFVVLLSKISVDSPPADVKQAIAESEVDLVLGISYERSEGAPRRWGRTYVTGLPGSTKGARLMVAEVQFDTKLAPTRLETASEVVSPEASPEDKGAAAALETLLTTVMAPYQEVVGSTTQAVATVWRGDSPLHDFVTDAMRQAAGSDVALINVGAIQDELAAGEIRRQDVFRLVPFDNAVVKVKLTGSALKKALEEELGRGSLLQPAGIQCRLSENADGSFKLESVRIGSSRLPLDHVYTVALTDYLADRIGLPSAQRQSVHPSLRELAIQQIKLHSPLKLAGDGRLRFGTAPTSGH